MRRLGEGFGTSLGVAPESCKLAGRQNCHVTMRMLGQRVFGARMRGPTLVNVALPLIGRNGDGAGRNDREGLLIDPRE